LKQQARTGEEGERSARRGAQPRGGAWGVVGWVGRGGQGNRVAEQVRRRASATGTCGPWPWAILGGELEKRTAGQVARGVDAWWGRERGGVVGSVRTCAFAAMLPGQLVVAEISLGLSLSAAGCS
jgi:hypothetical protein